ncbi:MAG: HlyD family secretion protein [Saprospiraceae bacterium]|jgi:multidrug resistance efflux pump
MLNISNNTITNKLSIDSFNSFKKSSISSAGKNFRKGLVVVFFFIFIISFMPWTQNIQSRGEVTTLKPEQRPQTIHSAIPGRIEKWYVTEGDYVKKGDTVVFLSEIKQEYFDPQLVERTKNQIRAKEESLNAYRQKIEALKLQAKSLEAEQALKINSLKNKIDQYGFKVISDSIEQIQSQIDFEIASRQLERFDTLYKSGIKTLTDLEGKRLKWQETSTKLVGNTNKLASSRVFLENAGIELEMNNFEFQQKIAKIQSDIFSALSQANETISEINKLEIQAANYEKRNSFYYMTAPQDGYITKVIKPGIGEILKEGEPLVSIIPGFYELAVELYINPMDLPLIELEQEVRFIFDGWPAFVFSGWPGSFFGTFKGNVKAIDNNISSNGKYRILIAEDASQKPWPKQLRPGSGAQGIALLNNVPIWYEIWRQLNGFPPEFYKNSTK